MTMPNLTPEGQAKLAEIAARHGVSPDAAAALLAALIRGGGTMAQFNHPELGGSGQWMQGGMTMVGDMFNTRLKATVDGLCGELSQVLASQPSLLAGQPAQRQGGGQTQSQYQGSGGPRGSGSGGEPSLFVPADVGGGRWWPEQLGTPNAAGSQNNVRYAWFAGPRRLAIEVGGRVTLYDTGDHRIGGVSQQQEAGGASLTFTSQHGRIPLSSLPVVTDRPDSGTPELDMQAGGGMQTGGAPEAPEATAGGADSPGRPETPGSGDWPLPDRSAPPGEAPAAAPAKTAEGFAAEALAGTAWTLSEAVGDTGGPVLGEIRLEPDGAVAGSAGIGVRYWAVEHGALRLYDADGRTLAHFAAAGSAAGVSQPLIAGRSTRDPSVAYVLAAPAPDAAGTRPGAGEGEPVSLDLRIPLTEAVWRLSDAGGRTLAELRFLPDGRIEGSPRPTEAGWRVEESRLVLLHGSGRPTARFDTFQIREDGWTLRGTLPSSDEVVVLTLDQS